LRSLEHRCVQGQLRCIYHQNLLEKFPSLE
jgi:hypothetical protein